MNPGRSNRPPSTSTNRSSGVWLASVISSWTLRYFSSSVSDSCVVASKRSLIGAEVGAEVGEAPVFLPGELVQPAVVLRVLADRAVDAGEQVLVDRLDERVEADVLAADV